MPKINANSVSDGVAWKARPKSLLHVERFLEEVPWEKKALEELGETPEIREASLREFRQRVEDIDEFRPYIDDQFFLGFLRVRKFDIDRAVKSYKRFFGMRLLDPKKYFPVGQGPLDLKANYGFAVGTMLRRRNPIDNTAVIILRVGDWTPESGYDVSDLFTPVALALLTYGMDDTSQVFGTSFVLDLRELHLGHLRCFPLSAIRALIRMVADSFPGRFKAFHIFYANRFFDYMFFVAKPFLSHKIQQRIHTHGKDINALHDYICPSILPEEYGGQDGPFEVDHFLEPLYKVHDKLVEFSYYGYDK